MELEFERMCHAGHPRPPKGQGFGGIYEQGYFINYLHGLDFLCRNHIAKTTRVLELGCFYGASSQLFSQYSNNVTCVDIEYYPEMKEVVEKHGIKFIKQDSTSFLQSIEKGSYDFIYIDTTHGFSDTLQEIKSVYDKLDNGQWIAGHDFNCVGVQDAVNRAFKYPDIQIYLDSSWVIQKTEKLIFQEKDWR
jgi:predicted O-methyltransferase YrrM